jgi:hypothetical protein
MDKRDLQRVNHESKPVEASFIGLEEAQNWFPAIPGDQIKPGSEVDFLHPNLSPITSLFYLF